MQSPTRDLNETTPAADAQIPQFAYGDINIVEDAVARRDNLAIVDGKAVFERDDVANLFQRFPRRRADIEQDVLMQQRIAEAIRRDQPVYGLHASNELLPSEPLARHDCAS